MLATEAPTQQLQVYFLNFTIIMTKAMYFFKNFCLRCVYLEQIEGIQLFFEVITRRK